MAKELPNKNCPLKLLSRYTDKIAPQQLSLSNLDKQVRHYLELPESDRPAQRDAIFFQLSPMLLKSLSWYCHISSGCGVNCQIGGLLSNAFIVFASLIDKFDPDRHLNFLGYIVKRLSWGIFDSYLKERRYSERRVFMSTETMDSSEQIEEKCLSAVELEELMSTLRPAARDLFMLHHLFGYSYADLITLQKTNVKTIQKTIERARKKMLEVYSNK